MSSKEEERLVNERGQKIDLDEALQSLGKPGAYTALICVLGLLMNAFVAFNHVSLPSLYAVPSSIRCTDAATSYKSGNFTMITLHPTRNMSYLESGILEEKNDPCFYQMKVSDNNKTVFKEFQCKKWMYSHPHGKAKTWSDQWDLVCSRRYLVNLGQSVYMIGVMIGSPVMGMLSDQFGRRPILLVCLAVSCIVSISLAFIPNFIAVIVCRFIVGFFISGVHSVVYIIPMETTSRKQRTLLSTAMLNSFIISVFIGCAVIYVIRDWQMVEIALCVPAILFLLLALVWLPESPRWSHANRRKDKCKDFFIKAMKFNRMKDEGRERIEQFLNQYEHEPIEEKERRYTVLDVFRTPKIRRRSLIGIYMWFTAGVSYYALSYNMPNLNENPFLAILIGSSTDIPSFLLAFLYIPRFGKRKSLVFVMITGGILCICYKSYSSLVILLIGKMGIAVSFGLVFIYLPEIYPTVIRNIGIGTLSFFARLGSVIAPQLVLVGVYTDPSVPIIIVGCMSILAGILSIFSPETKGKELPVTIEEVESKHQFNGEVCMQQVSKDVENVLVEN